MVGMNLGYSGGKYKQLYNSGENTTNNSNNYNVGIFLKKYLLPARFTPYFGADIYYYRGVYKQVSDNLGTNTSQSNSYGLGPSLGLAYLISNRFLVETQLVDIYLAHSAETKQWGGGLNAGFRPNFSLSYVF